MLWFPTLSTSIPESPGESLKVPETSWKNPWKILESPVKWLQDTWVTFNPPRPDFIRFSKNLLLPVEAFLTFSLCVCLHLTSLRGLIPDVTAQFNLPEVCVNVVLSG